MRNDIFRTYVYVVLGMFVLFDIAIIAADQFHDIQDITIEPVFQIVSTITSTGYTVTNFENWGTTVLVLVFLLMFTGRVPEARPEVPSLTASVAS